jgi:hypothetical protein
MDSGREVEDEWFGGDYDGTAATNDGLDFFNQAPSFHTAPLHSGGHRSFSRHGAAAVQGLDLNSQAMDITDNMSCMDTLRSSPDGVVMEGNRSGAGRGAGRAAGRGAGHAAGHGAGAVRGTGRATLAPTSVVADHDIRVSSRPSGGARGRGRAAPSCPPAATSSCQFRPPRPAGGQSNTGVATHGVADATFDGGLHDPAEFNWSQDPYDEDDDDVQEIEETRDDLFDKADWSNNANNAAFCELCVEEIRAGNTNNGHMTNRGYTNIAAKFEEQTGLRHSKRQFKNRWDALRRMYTFWLCLNKQSGLGRSGGTVVADDAWWKKHTKGHMD